MPAINLPGILSEAQYRWLKLRASVPTDAETSRKLEISKNTVKTWKKDAAFSTVLDLLHTDRVQAFKVLGLSFFEQALDALEYLFTSSRGADKKAALQLWMAITRVGAPDVEDTTTLPQQVFNILNLRGDIPKEALDMINPVRQLPAPRVLSVEKE